MRKRRASIIFIAGTVILALLAGTAPQIIEQSVRENSTPAQTSEVTPAETKAVQVGSALEALEKLEIKGRAPKTGYERSEFGDGWSTVNGCSTRNIILYRDLENVVLDDECRVVSGVLNDSFSGEVIQFSKDEGSKVQIDHLVALSDAWQKGAQLLTKEKRVQLANDPLELLAVSGAQNQAKSDGDAATWLPKNKAFRCEYIARQIAVKIKYTLWVTQAENQAMASILSSCPDQPLP